MLHNLIPSVIPGEATPDLIRGSETRNPAEESSKTQ
jgi:hypothetical protein